jgi:hypothetical protein
MPDVYSIITTVDPAVVARVADAMEISAADPQHPTSRSTRRTAATCRSPTLPSTPSSCTGCSRTCRNPTWLVRRLPA